MFMDWIYACAENVTTFGIFFLTLSFMVMVLRSFHNKYFIWYSNLARGIKFELIVSFIVAFLMAAFTYIFWPIVLLIIGLIVFLNIRKATELWQRLVWIIPMGVVSVFIAFVGTCCWISSRC